MPASRVTSRRLSAAEAALSEQAQRRGDDGPPRALLCAPRASRGLALRLLATTPTRPGSWPIVI